VEILFGDRKLEKQCTQLKEARRVFGDQRAKKLFLRLDQLRAAPHLEVMRFLPGRTHELTGDLKGCLSIDVDGPYRLIFKPNHDPPPLKADGGLDWSKVIAITILEAAKDTHE
jgi:plasmid maintenance system killer protein